MKKKVPIQIVLNPDERITQLESELRRMSLDHMCTRSDWERAHKLLDEAGVLNALDGVGVHLIDRLRAVLAVWEPIGRLSAASCHDLRFLCNVPEEAREAIKAHRAAYRGEEIEDEA